MPQNIKDSNGGKTKPAERAASNHSKRNEKGRADNKSGSPAGSQDKGEKKTTP